jgi:hypothetical protein
MEGEEQYAAGLAQDMSLHIQKYLYDDDIDILGEDDENDNW